MQDLLSAFSLAGKNALVVRPEYSYGREIACGLAKAGAKVWLAGPDAAALKSVEAYMAESDAKSEGGFEYHPGTGAESEKLAAAAKAAMGRIDVLVENSSSEQVSGWKQGFDEIARQLKETHLAVMLTVQAVGRVVAEHEDGSVILVSDYGALVGYDPQNYVNCPEYFDTDFSLVKGYVKGGCVNYARQAAGYLGEHGCRCNCIAYGPMAGKQPAAFEEAYVSHSHLKRLADAEDVALAAVYLSSDASRFVTGVTLPVDGGYCAK